MSISINTSGFSCPWDSGQVGFIYCTLEDAAKNWGVPENWKAAIALPAGPILLEGNEYQPFKEINMGPHMVTLRQATERVLRGEVRTYDQYLQGDVWGYEIVDNDEEVIDSCWGFYGEDCCRQEAEDALAYLQKQVA